MIDALFLDGSVQRGLRVQDLRRGSLVLTLDGRRCRQLPHGAEVIVADPGVWAHPEAHIDDIVRELVEAREALAAKADALDQLQGLESAMRTTKEALVRQVTRVMDTVSAIRWHANIAVSRLADTAHRRKLMLSIAGALQNFVRNTGIAAISSELRRLSAASDTFNRDARPILAALESCAVPEGSLVRYVPDRQAWWAQLRADTASITQLANSTRTAATEWHDRASAIATSCTLLPVGSQAKPLDTIDSSLLELQALHDVIQKLPLPSDARAASRLAAATDELATKHEAAQHLGELLADVIADLDRAANELRTDFITLCTAASNIIECMIHGRPIVDGARKLSVAMETLTAAVGEYAVLHDMPAVAFRTIAKVATEKQVYLPAPACSTTPASGLAAARAFASQLPATYAGSLVVTDSIIAAAAALIASSDAVRRLAPCQLRARACGRGGCWRR